MHIEAPHADHRHREWHHHLDASVTWELQVGNITLVYVAVDSDTSKVIHLRLSCGAQEVLIEVTQQYMLGDAVGADITGEVVRSSAHHAAEDDLPREAITGEDVWCTEGLGDVCALEILFLD